MTYFEIVPTQSTLNQLPSNPCQLLDFNLLRLALGESYASHSAGREILAVLLGGKGSFTVGDHTFHEVGGRSNVFSGKPHAVYIPCGSQFEITAQSQLEVALCSAPSDLEIKPYLISPADITSGVWGAANFTRNFHQILTQSSQPNLPAARLIVGETYTPSGNWSTYPPHKHEVDDLPREAYHEEMYFFKVNPPDGFGIARYYNGEVDTGYTVRDNSILLIPRGYHTVVSAPGYTTYYLWFLAGNHRIQAVVEDSHVGWVGRTVPMLRDLGH